VRRFVYCPCLGVWTHQYVLPQLHVRVTPLPPTLIERFSCPLWPPMADFDIFREQLSIKYFRNGHALWEPRPPKPNNPVKVGDVGFIRNGRFHSLFNALLSAEDQSSVPEHYEQLVPKFTDHISRSTFISGHYCSDGINVELEENFQASR
jgi:hypothetical protein